MDTIKRWLEIHVPVTTCTLRCSYCYITTHRLFEGPLPHYPFDADFIKKAYSKERLGGTCLVNLCAGGETLLSPQIVDFIRAFLEEGHYVSVVTNGTLSKRLAEIAEFPKELTAHLFFKFSYHYVQLKERGLLDTFFDNIRRVRDAGCSFTLEQTPSDDVIPIQDEIIDRAIKEVGAVPHISVARDERIDGKLPILTELDRTQYKEIWGKKYKSALFDYKMTIFEQKRKEFCYAGDWAYFINLLTGDIRQCYHGQVIGNMYADLSKPLPKSPVGHHCPSLHCWNGHSWITLGCIPELSAPTYAELRNRVTTEGTEWLQPQVKAFMSTKLYDSNKEYSAIKKCFVDLRTECNVFKNSARQVLTRILHLK